VVTAAYWKLTPAGTPPNVATPNGEFWKQRVTMMGRPTPLSHVVTGEGAWELQSGAEQDNVLARVVSLIMFSASYARPRMPAPGGS
jgi:hypothetical protein